jgi:hypothetical protein
MKMGPNILWPCRANGPFSEQALSSYFRLPAFQRCARGSQLLEHATPRPAPYEQPAACGGERNASAEHQPVPSKRADDGQDARGSKCNPKDTVDEVRNRLPADGTSCPFREPAHDRPPQAGRSTAAVKFPERRDRLRPRHQADDDAGGRAPGAVIAPSAAAIRTTPRNKAPHMSTPPCTVVRSIPLLFHGF